MNSNLILNILLLVILFLLVLDCVFCSSAVLQTICVFLVVAVFALCYGIFKIKKGRHCLSEKEMSDYLALKMENISLTNEILRTKRQPAISGEQLENVQKIVLANKRLAYQNENLQAYIEQFHERSSKVVKIPPVQKETPLLKKSNPK